MQLDPAIREKIIRAVSGRVWHKRGKWHHTVLFDEICAAGESVPYAQKLGFDFGRTIGAWLPDGDYLDLENDWDTIRERVRSAASRDSSFLTEYADLCFSQGELLLRTSADISQVDAAALTSDALCDLLEKEYEAQKHFLPFMMSMHVVDEFLSERFTAFLDAFARARGFSLTEKFEYQASLTLPYRKVYVSQEREDFLKLAVAALDTAHPMPPEEVTAALSRHADEYGFLNAVLLEDLPFTVEHYREALAGMSFEAAREELAALTKGQEEMEAQQRACMQDVSGDAELLETARFIQRYAFLRSYRVDVCYKAMAMCLNILAELARRIGVSVLDLTYLNSYEIRESLAGGDSAPAYALIAQRRRGFLSVFVDNTRYTFTGVEAEEVARTIAFSQEMGDGTVKGSVAFPGKARGVCKVLRMVEDMKKVERGDIIVISMTDPNYLPAMERAAAFVTDMGGILCHAAIVAREMKKPCIIGTKIATQILKDGDVVEVDAENGIVRLIERS